MWVVTRAINTYDQDGVYFVAAYQNKPSFQELKKLLPNEQSDVIKYLLRSGGGRMDVEYEWYFLDEVNDGECLYEE
jgi:hypothetical protein